VASLLDKVEIQETISLYHEAGSTTDWDQMMATFLPDGIWEVPALRIRSQGQAAIREAMTALMEPIEYLVQINAPAIIAVDGDAAAARSLIRECAKLHGQAGVIDVVGRFEDELRRTPDGWRFAHRTFTILGSHLSAEIPARGTG
jgi:ketosteroid isomerase-like protein